MTAVEAVSEGGRVPALVDGPRRYRSGLLGSIQVAGISRIGWPLSSGLGGRFAPESVAAFSRSA
ncbi:MAG: hypothetical protein ACYCTI_13580, partial [Acidimicrobiales bacterium]